MRRPDVAMNMLIRLQSGPMRSGNIVRPITNEFEISEPTVYLILKELELRGYIVRKEFSPKNVQYNLSNEGDLFLDNEFKKTYNSLQQAVQQSPYCDKIILDLYLQSIITTFKSTFSDIKFDSDQLISHVRNIGEPLFKGSQEIAVNQLEHELKEYL